MAFKGLNDFDEKMVSIRQKMTISTTSLKFSFQRLRWTLSGLWRRLILCRREVWTVITSTISIQYLQRSLKRQMVVYIEIFQRSQQRRPRTLCPRKPGEYEVLMNDTNDNVNIVVGVSLRKCTFLNIHDFHETLSTQFKFPLCSLERSSSSTSRRETRCLYFTTLSFLPNHFMKSG